MISLDGDLLLHFLESQSRFPESRSDHKHPQHGGNSSKDQEQSGTTARAGPEASELHKTSFWLLVSCYE